MIAQSAGSDPLFYFIQIPDHHFNPCCHPFKVILLFLNIGLHALLVALKVTFKSFSSRYTSFQLLQASVKNLLRSLLFLGGSFTHSSPNVYFRFRLICILVSHQESTKKPGLRVADVSSWILLLPCPANNIVVF